MKYLSTALLIAISASALVAPQIAKAEDPVTFKFQSMELNSDDSREKLLLRLKTKAKMACSTSSYLSLSAFKKCRDDIESQFIAAINNPALTALTSKENVSIASSY